MRNQIRFRKFRKPKKNGKNSSEWKLGVRNLKFPFFHTKAKPKSEPRSEIEIFHAVAKNIFLNLFLEVNPLGTWRNLFFQFLYQTKN